MLDIDHFREINEGFGHDAGEFVVSQIGQRLVAAMGAHDLIAHVGTDQFAILACSQGNPKHVEATTRHLFSALAKPLTEMAKFISLPALVGLPLSLAWKQLSAIGRGFVWTNLVSMLAVLGWLYIAAPVRVCSNYLLDQQTGAGWLMTNLAVLLFAWWLGTLFLGGESATLERDAADGIDNLLKP